MGVVLTMMMELVTMGLWTDQAATRQAMLALLLLPSTSDHCSPGLTGSLEEERRTPPNAS